MSNQEGRPTYRALTQEEIDQACREDDRRRMSLGTEVLREIEQGILAHDIIEGTIEIERITQEDDTTPFGIWRSRS